MTEQQKDGRLHSEAAEMALLGAILQSPNELNRINGIITAADFYYKHNSIIFQELLELNAAGSEIDTIILSESLKSKNLISQVGGAYYLTGLADECPAPSRADYYAKTIRKYSNSRRKQRLAKQMVQNPSDKAIETEFFEILNQENSIPSFNESDAGNAEMLSHLFGGQIRYNHTEGIWLIWNAYYWEPDIRKTLHEYAKATAMGRQKSALSINDPNKKKQSMGFAFKSEDQYRIKACIESAKSLPLISTTALEWDNNPFLLQCENGLIALDKEIKFSLASSDLMITKCTHIKYDPNAKCPNFEKALSQMMNGRKNLTDFIQRAVGYSLSGDISEQCFFILHGTGANGKTVLQNIFESILGDYAIHSQFTAFTRKYYNTQTNDLARLHSARIVIASEGSDSKKFDEERLKQLTGGDNVTARYLYKEPFTFKPQFKLWLAVNSLPRVEDFSQGFWRRVRIIPFDVAFKGENIDPNLIDKLKMELPGILNWALRGFQEWKNQGLNPPNEVVSATRDYQNENDFVKQFLEDETLIDDKSRIRTNELYSAFCNWHEREYGGKPMTQNSFSRRVGSCISRKPEKIGSYKWFVGIQLKERSVES